MGRLRDRIDWPLATLGAGMVAVTVLYAVHFFIAGDRRDRQIQGLRDDLAQVQAELDRTETQLALTQGALAADDATIAQLHRELAVIARRGHLTAADLRRLRHQSRPRAAITATSPSPGPTVTVTATPPAHHRHPHKAHHRKAPVGCTGGLVAGRCISPPPVPTPTLRVF